MARAAGPEPQAGGVREAAADAHEVTPAARLVRLNAIGRGTSDTSLKGGRTPHSARNLLAPPGVLSPLGLLHPDRLHVDELVHAEAREFAPVAALLHTA